VTIIGINRTPSSRHLAGFAVLWLLFFAGAAGVAMARGSGPWRAAILAAVALTVPVVGWVFPPFLRWTYLGMSYATYPIGLVVSSLVLLLLYYGVVTPIGLLLRLTGYDPLGRRFDPKASSYWSPRQEPEDARRYFQQF